MASSSLQDLLAEEGFKAKKFTSHRTSLGSNAKSMPLYLYKDQNPVESTSTGVRRTGRTRSDTSRYDAGNIGVRNQLPRDNLLGSRRIIKGSSNLRGTGDDDEVDPNGVQEVKRLNTRLSVDLLGKEIADGRRHSDAQESHKYKDIFANDVYERDEGRIGSSNGFGDKERHKYSSSKLSLGRSTSVNMNTSRRLQKQESSSSKSTKSLHSRKQLDVGPSVPEPALDEAAIKATISILTGYIRRFLDDRDFRESVRDNCLSSLISNTLEEIEHADNKVIPNLEEAIETIERFVEASGDPKDLKKASFQLSVITSLSSKELKDGFSSGIPNAQLAACAHLYLSVVYKLLKKDKVSAKHLLQVFCHSPFQARTILLPEVWDYLLLPNLAHLKVWYDQEASSIPDTSSKPRKLQLLEKVYNEILDSGTSQFAEYYKDWLTEGLEAPSVPSIQIPSLSVQGRGNLHETSSEHASPVGSVSSQPRISKKLYDTVFCHSDKLNDAGETDGGEEEDNFDNCESSFTGTVEEEKKTVTCSPEQGKYTRPELNMDSGISGSEDAPQRADELLQSSEDGWQLPKIFLPNEELKVKAQATSLWSTTSVNFHSSHLIPHEKANDLILKKLAGSVFQEPQPRDSTLSVNDSYKMQLTNMISRAEEQYISDEYQEDGSFFSDIPSDFICPLTGELFEDPVTLETGQTFERMAIKEWFDKGKTTCPLTGKKLESLGLPITNSVLKRVIDSWKSERCRNLLAFASKIDASSKHDFKSKDRKAVLVLEQILVGFRTEERLMNAKHLISLGGLQFLILRFELGTMEEKSRIIVLLLCCIEADGSCRNFIAKNVNRTCLLELLHNKKVKSRENAVKLLTELICLQRRTEVMSFLSSLQKEGVINTMHVLLVYLQSSPLDQRPLIAILLLHFDLMVEPKKYSIYREEAVDSLTVALECSITNEKVRAQCCRALLILGGHMSITGELLTENWLLKHAGFTDGCDTFDLDIIDENSQKDNMILLAEEEKAREDWWKNLAASLLGNGKKSFLETVSKCLGSGDSSLVRICLITVAWLSQALSESPDTEFQLSAFSELIPRLKEILENGDQVEHRVLASMALLNFSRISECRVLLMTIGEEILIPLQSLAVVTWTAKQLHEIISGERL